MVNAILWQGTSYGAARFIMYRNYWEADQEMAITCIARKQKKNIVPTQGLQTDCEHANNSEPSQNPYLVAWCETLDSVTVVVSYSVEWHFFHCCVLYFQAIMLIIRYGKRAPYITSLSCYLVWNFRLRNSGGELLSRMTLFSLLCLVFSSYNAHNPLWKTCSIHHIPILSPLHYTQSHFFKFAWFLKIYICPLILTTKYGSTQ